MAHYAGNDDLTAVEVLVIIRRDEFGAGLQRTLEAIERHTAEVRVWLNEADTGDTHARTEPAVDGRGVAVCVPAGRGPAADAFAREALTAHPEADVVLVEEGVTFGPRWLDELRNAAYADSTIATASGVPDRVLGPPVRVARSAHFDARAAGGVALTRPLRGCIYVRRDALRAALAATAMSPEPALESLEEVSYRPGLTHVLAGTAIQGAREVDLGDPTDLATPSIRRALARVEAVSEPLRVTIDLRCCSFAMSGTQVHALNLVTRLARREDLRLTVVVPGRVDPAVRPHMDGLPPSVRRHTEGQGSLPEAHVFHRPYQLFHDIELSDALAAGTRFVLTHQDLIMDRAPAYFRSDDEWRRYVRTSATSLVATDEVVFFSEHARGEALRDGLVDQAKTSVIPPGTDHLDGADAMEMMPARSADALASGTRPFVLVFGNSYLHKNRLFALRVAEELRQNREWDGAMVLAGGKPGMGGSVEDEQAFLRGHRALAETLVDLGPIADDEQRWLYRHASVVMYPTLYEGFGLVPFEAAAKGTACVYSSRSSVAEFLPPDGAILDLGDVVDTANRLEALMASQEARDDIVRAIRAAGASLTWKRAADSYADVYRRSMTRPVGLALLSQQVILADTSAPVSSETERRLLVLLRRSAAFRFVVEGALNAVVALRRVAKRRQ